ncbi:MAG: thiol reductase thioredoxin [Pseudodesulfovibrio sp.]|nr:thiol reductase thioredoxin [Pseudodesulfovibrio sp.]
MTVENRLIVCPDCRSINRIQPDRAAQATCGKCKAKVFQSTPVELVGSTFDRHISKTEILMLVDFYSPTCAPCLMMGPQFDEAAKSLYPLARLAKIDTTAEQAIASRFNIASVPTMIIFKGGKEIARQSGALLGAEITAWVKKSI